MHFLLILHLLIVIIFTLRILLRDDLSPPARLAWFIILAVLPYAGSIIYFLFGEVDLGHRADREHQEIFARIRAQASDFMGQHGAADDLIAEEYRPAFHYAASINGFHAVPGNQAELMASTGETRRRMIADMDAARDHIHVLYYIWLQDDTGTEIAEALIRAAQRGVTCRAMADGLGSRAMIRSELWQKMKNAGVQLASALPLSNIPKTILTSRLDLRNHRKITIVDGSVTYCGSRNSADPEFRVKAKYAPWVDILLRVEGPVVSQNQLLFASDWMAATGDNLSEIPIPPQEPKPGFPAQIIGDGPTERRGATPQLFATLLASARQKITLSTPYFVPDASVLEALCAAAHRGVAVTLIFPARNDSWVVAAASRSYYRKLLEAGCIIHEFDGGLLHAKTLTIDGQVTLMGSTNLDLRSFDLNYENNILLQDQTITAAVEERQADYIASARPIGLEEVVNWPYHRRIWHNVIATVGPVL